MKLERTETQTGRLVIQCRLVQSQLLTALQ